MAPEEIDRVYAVTYNEDTLTKKRGICSWI